MRRALPFAALVAAAAAAPAQVSYPPAAPVMVQQQEVVLDASGNATWTFDVPFPTEPAVAHIPRALDTTNPLICNFTAVSTTAVTIHCWRTNLTGLLTGLLSGPPAGGKVKLLARAIP